MGKIKVIIGNKQKEVKVPTGPRMLTRRCCNAVLRLEKFPYPTEISVTFINDEQIRELGHQYHERDVPTDALSFLMDENEQYDEDHDTGAKILGDIVLSMEKVVEQADRYGHNLERKVEYPCTRSMLHLLGYNYGQGEMDRVRMRKKEEQVMTQLGLPSTSGYILDEDEE